MTIRELRIIAKENGLKNIHSYKKNNLIEELNSKYKLNLAKDEYFYYEVNEFSKEDLKKLNYSLAGTINSYKSKKKIYYKLKKEDKRNKEIKKLGIKPNRHLKKYK